MQMLDIGGQNSEGFTHTPEWLLKHDNIYKVLLTVTKESIYLNEQEDCAVH
jgi:hypothetical protein